MTGSAGKGGLALFRDFRLLLYLFVGFRLMMLIVYQPILVGGIERGVTAGGDFSYFYALGQLSDAGHLPFRDYWYEFPPLWAASYLAVYQLTASGAGPSYTTFASMMGLVMLAFDTGSLVLLRRIGGCLHGSDVGLSLAWVYAALTAPAVFIWWNFESIVAFWFLLGLWELVQGRDLRGGVATLAGSLFKFVPLVLLGPVWRFWGWRAALRYTLVALGGFALVYGLLIAVTGEMGTASLLAQFSKASYGTVWALLDGNYTTGIFGSIEAHFDPASATEPQGNPAVIPWWLRLVVFGGAGLYAFAQVRRFDARGVVAFAGLTLLLFFLWAQGWSPQWLLLIIPLVLLNFPDRNGVLLVLLLSLMAFTEYPLLFIRTGDTGGVLTGGLVPPFVALVLARTAILAGLAVALFLRLRRPVGEVE